MLWDRQLFEFHLKVYSELKNKNRYDTMNIYERQYFANSMNKLALAKYMILPEGRSMKFCFLVGGVPAAWF